MIMGLNENVSSSFVFFLDYSLCFVFITVVDTIGKKLNFLGTLESKKIATSLTEDYLLMRNRKILSN